MIHDQSWFEMPDKQKRRLTMASWVPLYASQVTSNGQFAEPEHWEEYFGAVAVTFPKNSDDLIDRLTWGDLTCDGHRPSVDSGEYMPASRFTHWNSDAVGDYLVLRNSFETDDADEILIEPDLILGLRLLREGDVWVAPYEDYVPVIRLKKDTNGRVELVEIRGEHLKDYLCARDHGLLVSTFRSRTEIAETAPAFNLSPAWKSKGAKWDGGVLEVDREGAPYAWTTAVLVMGRTDVDQEDDVPILDFPSDDSSWSSQSEFTRHGPKRYRVTGEMWQNEWIAPGEHSPRLRGDRIESTVEFIVDNSGRRVEAPELIGRHSRWLWFSPGVINELLSHRGTKLGWYSEYTGALVLPAERSVHFGVNASCLINVYAKDIALLGILWQRLWAAWNVAPEGKVARELLATQMEVLPVETTAPEILLERALSKVNEAFAAKFGAQLFKEHLAEAAILRNIHRFTAVNEKGFYELMKDLTRLCVERLDVTELRKLTPNADTQLGTLKRLALILDADGANGRESVRELVGIYELRQSDSHLPSSDVENALALVGLSPDSMPMERGMEAIRRVAECLMRVANLLER